MSRVLVLVLLLLNRNSHADKCQLEDIASKQSPRRQTAGLSPGYYRILLSSTSEIQFQSGLKTFVLVSVDCESPAQQRVHHQATAFIEGKSSNTTLLQFRSDMKCALSIYLATHDYNAASTSDLLDILSSLIPPCRFSANTNTCNEWKDLDLLSAATKPTAFPPARCTVTKASSSLVGDMALSVGRSHYYEISITEIKQIDDYLPSKELLDDWDSQLGQRGDPLLPKTLREELLPAHQSYLEGLGKTTFILHKLSEFKSIEGDDWISISKQLSEVPQYVDQKAKISKNELTTLRHLCKDTEEIRGIIRRQGRDTSAIQQLNRWCE